MSFCLGYHYFVFQGKKKRKKAPFPFFFCTFACFDFDIFFFSIQFYQPGVLGYFLKHK